MRQWIFLLQKEMLENIRNFKWIWMPLVFIILAVQQPVTMYYMPQIIEKFGGLPEGTVLQFPTPSAEEVIAASLTQYNSLGILIIVLSTMGIIASERKSGVAAMILVKPVSYTSFVTSKWIGSMLLLWVSFFCGYLGAWYYTGILFEFVPFSIFIESLLLYGIWLSFVTTLTLFFNSFMKSSGMIAFITLTIIILLSVFSSTLSNTLSWSPALLSNYVTQYLMMGVFPEEMTASLLLAIVSIIALLIASIFLFRKNELAA